jgi:hypothetical protein
MHCYKRHRFSYESMQLIVTINEVVDDYTAQGYKLTVRQLYYQLVARNVIPNTERSYKNICTLVNNARIAGLMDWEAIEDRTRAFVRRQRWLSGRQIVQAAANSFHMDMWDNQPSRVFIIIEKEALVGVLEPIGHKLDVPILAARGYPSASVLREFVEEDIIPSADSQTITILHLGDHDPSGLDMTRDLRDRIELFAEGAPAELVRIALSMEQIEERKPPPNPAKTTDPRFADYRNMFGDESWELDALPPSYISELVQSEIAKIVDVDLWIERTEEVEKIRKKLTNTAKRFRG